MASPQVTVRLDPETYKTLVKLAELDKKNLAELTRELIEQGLGKRQTIETELLERLNMMSAELGELTARAVKASAASLYFAKLATDFTQETAHFVTTSKIEGQPLDQETKWQRTANWDKKAKEFEQVFLTAPFEKL